MKDYEYTPGDLVTFDYIQVESIETANLKDLGVVMGIDNGRYVDTVYKIYWFKTMKMSLSLACHLKLVYTMENK
jgi:hypothetical protein